MSNGNKDIADKIARLLGWIDYPDDSLEQGCMWHQNAERAPHGPTCYKYEFERDLRKSYIIMDLIEKFSIEFKWLSDATLEVHSVITSKTITTTAGYTEGVLECLSS